MSGVIRGMATILVGTFGLVSALLIGATVLDPITSFVTASSAVQNTYGTSMVTDIQRSVLQWMPLVTMAVLGTSAVIYLLRREQFAGRRR